ncbi:unnamed protein product [Dibothriocephalus latus]|uniref:Uncharacterized protein n=1 Tax=Dibothriocephalus latus TaxID=60516 RepID=A0A3P7NZA1_DIBLA|nr:unnamed protein product [Dibothriocephalus latus]
MIAAVKSVVNQTEAMEETKNPIQKQVSSLLMAHQPREVLPKVERVALRALKTDRDIIIVPANKGRSTIIFDSTDFLQKAKNTGGLSVLCSLRNQSHQNADTRNQFNPVGSRELEYNNAV